MGIGKPDGNDISNKYVVSTMFNFLLYTLIFFSLSKGDTKIRSGNSCSGKNEVPIFQHNQLYLQEQEKNIWLDLSEDLFSKKGSKKEYVKFYRTLLLDTASLRRILCDDVEPDKSLRNAKSTILLPLPDGSFLKFKFTRSQTIDSGEQAEKHQHIKTFMGQGVDNVYAGVAFDVSASGFHAMITLQDKTVFIEPYRRNDLLHYICYYKHDIQKRNPIPFEKTGPIRP